MAAHFEIQRRLRIEATLQSRILASIVQPTNGSRRLARGRLRAGAAEQLA
jgi:hypothetical protein